MDRTGLRRRRRRITVVGAFTAVLLASVSIPGVTRMASSAGTVLASAVTDSSPAVSVLDGRWIAILLDGHDISGWRDTSGLPANIIFGADRSHGEWQLSRDCGALIRGQYALRPDGSFRPTIPIPPVVGCPLLQAVMPDLLGALSRTEFAVTEGKDARYPRVLKFLDKDENLIMSWREDAATRSPAGLCRHVLGADAAYAGSFTTAEQIRWNVFGRVSERLSEVLPGVPDGEITVYCNAGRTRIFSRYAVTASGHIRPAI